MGDMTLGPTPARPKLRADLRIEEVAAGNFVAQIVDERFGKRVKLDRATLAVARLLDGQRDLGALMVKLDDEGMRLRPALLRQVLDFLERQLLLEGVAFERAATEGAGIPAEEHVILTGGAAAAGEPLRVFFLEEARHGCVACGLCCTGYELGPLTDEEAARLRGALFVAEGENLGSGPRVVDRVHGGMAYRAIATTERGACVFLGRDQKCIVHAECGAAAKPWFCRLFPLHFVSAPDGTVFGSLIMECFGYHAARNAGPLLAEQMGAVGTLVALARNVPVLKPQVSVGPRRTLALEEYYAVEHWLLEHFRGDPQGPEAALAQAGRFLAHLEEGGRVEDFAPDPGATSLLPNDELALEVSEFARACLAYATSAALAGMPEGTSPGMQRAFLDAVAFFSGEGDPDELAPGEEAGGPGDDLECLGILREFLRNEVFSKEWYRAGDLRYGYALTVARFLLAGAGACLLASRWGDERVGPKALCHALSLVLRCMRRKSVEEFLAKEGSPLARIYGAVARPGARPSNGLS